MAAQERAAIGARNDEELQFLEDVRNAFSLKSKMYAYFSLGSIYLYK